MRLSSQSLLWVALSIVVIAVGVVLAMTLWQIRRTVRNIEHRLDASLGQIDLTVEDLRKTNALVRDVLVHTEKGAANMAQVTDGVMDFGRTLGSVASLAGYMIVPAIGKMAGGMGAGISAVLSYGLNRLARKEENHG
jgi:uncharacterized protein YoxC